MAKKSAPKKQTPSRRGPSPKSRPEKRASKTARSKQKSKPSVRSRSKSKVTPKSKSVARKPIRSVSKRSVGTIKAKPSRRVAIPVKAPKKPVMQKPPISNLDLGTATARQIDRERKRIYNIRYKLNQQKKTAKTAKQRKEIRNELVRTGNFLAKAKEQLGEKVEKVLMGKQKYRIGEYILVDKIFKWFALERMEVFIDSGFFNTFVVDGQEFKRREVSRILGAIDQMETEADLSVPPIYYFRFTQNFNLKRLTVSFGG